jgi:hypothetical protein
MENNTATTHRWRFCRLGGFDQVRLESAEDIRHLGELDQKLWAALSCPVGGLEYDSRTLAMLDNDEDGRVRVQEILAAAKWIGSVLAKMDTFLAGSDQLPLNAIDVSHDEGRQLLASARQLLAYLGKPEAETLSITDVCNTDTLLHASQFNGDGIIAVHAAEDETTQKLIAEIMTCVGSEQDRSGLPGISERQVDAFFTAAQKYAEWWEQTASNPAILPFAEQTAAAAAVFARLRNKVDDYFMRCGLAAFDLKAEASLNPSLTNYEALASQELAVATVEVERFPLAHIEASRPLPLKVGINPAWEPTVQSFTTLVVTPLFGQIDQLDVARWQRIKETFAAYETWQSTKVGAEVESLGLERVKEILEGPGKTQLLDLIHQDLQLAAQVDAIDNVVRLVYYNRDLYRLLNNFVAFRDFYVQDRKAVFQAGTLYIDGRACELCIKVASVDGHSPLANLSRTYLAYCECKRRGSEQRMFIVAAFTGGDSDNLMLGRNGVFYDSKGDDWDATIVKIIDHPISVSQAFWAPYKRIGRMISEQIEKFAAAKDKAVDSKAGAGIAAVAGKPAGPPAPPVAPAAPAPPPPPLPFDVGKFAGIFAALGLAVGAMGTAVASFAGVFLALPLWQMPLAVAGLILAVSGPSMLIAFLKLRQRNLGPMLDANGWAVNTKARINIPFGSTLTKMAVLPKGSERTLTDPFAEKKTPWKRWVFLLVLLMALGFAWNKGYIQEWGKQLKSSVSEQKSAAPTAEKPAPAGK